MGRFLPLTVNSGVSGLCRFGPSEKKLTWSLEGPLPAKAADQL